MTICVDHRLNIFGKVEDGKMYLTDEGIIVNVFWNEISKHYQNIKLGHYVVMPDHVHGILYIVGDRHACPLPLRRRQYQLLPIVIGSFKSAVSKELNKDGFFKWQRSYHDRIIRDEMEFQKINKYIDENPMLDDKFL